MPRKRKRRARGPGGGAEAEASQLRIQHDAGQQALPCLPPPHPPQVPVHPAGHASSAIPANKPSCILPLHPPAGACSPCWATWTTSARCSSTTSTPGGWGAGPWCCAFALCLLAVAVAVPPWQPLGVGGLPRCVALASLTQFDLSSPCVVALLIWAPSLSSLCAAPARRLHPPLPSHPTT